VECASERSLAEYAWRSLFLPLGMTQTRFQDDHTTVVEHGVTGSVSDDHGTFHMSLPWYDAAGAAGLAGYATREP
jgi:CubicO group peptidase (beta-lactamase class C family)